MADAPEILVTTDDTVGPAHGPTSPRTASGSRPASTRGSREDV